MIQIEIDEKNGLLVVNGQALLLLTEEEHVYLNLLGRRLMRRLKKRQELSRKAEIKFPEDW